jgi:NAD(P)-dependent dehydrogenase (short-subunit alcohol dehydrogenase family)
MSTFSPGAPPGTNGSPVFKDIDFSVADSSSSESIVRNADPLAVFVVTGASRGIGLEFVKQLVDRTKGTVVACCRSPESATVLQEFTAGLEDSSRVQIIALDVEDQKSIESAGSVIKDRFGRVDVLLNVAGILGDAKTTPGPERSLSKLDRDWFEKTMAVNLIGPVMLSKELAPLMMQRRKKKISPDEEQRAVAVIANLSARVGSISDNGMGGWYSYRMSKTALNQATRTMALELKRSSTWCIALHPGTTQTDLSKPFSSNVKEDKLFPVDFTVSQLLDIIDAMDEETSGGFYDWSGQALSF